jgi:hypothetical protein
MKIEILVPDYSPKGSLMLAREANSRGPRLPKGFGCSTVR